MGVRFGRHAKDRIYSHSMSIMTTLKYCNFTSRLFIFQATNYNLLQAEDPYHPFQFKQNLQFHQSSRDHPPHPAQFTLQG